MEMTDDDDNLFRRAMSDAKPLKAEQRADDPLKKPKPRARFSRADKRAVLEESLHADLDTLEHDNADYLRFHRASVGRRTMRKLARGNIAVQDEIDLHGLTQGEAREYLHDFINRCASSGKTCVRVVHGKGLGSGHRGPVLKISVNRWLRRWDPVLAFVSTPQVDGGTGAVYVLLRKS